MLHLSTDRLAELGDASPSAEEAAHLEGCAACAGERNAYVALVGLARGERAPLGLPLTRWEAIAGELGQLAPAHVAPDRGPTLQARARTSRWPMQAAAGLLLCAGGAMLGRASAGAGLLPGFDASARPSPAALAGVTRPLPDSASFASVEEARTAQQQSELVYEQAAAFLAQHDTATREGSPVAYRSRLAALDEVISTTRQALREAPHDPVINDYYLTTIGQREATLRQLNTSLPASLRLTSF